MRKDFGAVSLMYPQILVIASYDQNGVPNALTAGGGISGMDEITLFLANQHKTVKNILETKAFTASIVSAEYLTECDYIGIVSGNRVPDKLQKAGFHTSKAAFVEAPIIDELPAAMECKLVSFDEKTGCMIGKIINSSIDESILLENGKIDSSKLRPVVVDQNNNYLVLDKKVGKAYQEGEKL